MKLFELLWDVRDGEHEYLIRKIRAFKSQQAADRYGATEEYQNNTGKKSKRKPTQNQLNKAQESACWDFGWSYKFDGASELRNVESDKGLYDVYLGKKLN